MPFTVVPALDITQGRLGVFTPDGPKRIDAFGGDPLTAAHAYVAAGARLLHIVDMDGAFGAPSDTSILAAVAAIPGVIAVQASGGVRSWDDARALLNAGAARVVISSAVLDDETAVAAIVGSARPGEVLFGVEVEAGRIRARGDHPVDLDLAATLGWLHGSGAAGFLVTAIGRVATESGPDLDLIRRVARAGRPTWAAGGIASVEHLGAVREAGAAGAIVGRAAMEGDLDLADAVAWAARG